MQKQETQWVDAAKAGDLDAFEAIVRAYEARVYHFVLKLVRNPEDALDLSQEVFLRVHRSLSLFRGQSEFSTWVFAIANNLCIDFARKQKRRGRLKLVSITDEEEQVRDLPDARYDPVETYERRALVEALDCALDEITPDLREIFLLREVSGLSYAEISELLDVELGTVKSRLARARATLAEKMRSARNNLNACASNEEKRR